MGLLRTFSTGPAPRIVLNAVDGDLMVSGWDRPDVQIRLRDDEGLVVQEGDGSLELSCRGDCVLQAPFQAKLQIGSIDGDAVISMMLGGVSVDNVDGDLRVASIGAATLGNVDGDLSARSVAGSFVVAAVDGDVRVAQVAGELQLGSVDGDLNLADVAGNIRVTVEGDASLIVNLAPGQQVIVAAGGDVNCQVPLDVNATVQVRAGGDIAVKRLGEIRKERNTSFAFQLGNGDGASIQLSADGDLLLRGVEMPKIGMNLSMDADIDAEMARRATELSLQIAQQVETQVANLTQELEEKFGEMSNNDELASKIQDRVQTALRRAEEKLAEAMRKIEARVQESEQRSTEDASRSRRKAYAWQAPPSPKPPKAPKATDEERMVILRMVEEGKISVEQAEQLLAAMSR